MKKLMLAALFAVVGLTAFADEAMQTKIANFLNKGNYIAVQKKAETIYYPKSILTRLECNSNKFTFYYAEKEFEYDDESFNYTKTDISLDANNNLIIKD